ncbi:MAG: fibronectin type III domain-containing protein, partial [Planctomycetes bacterium]|nr:fibronectin type III domain-containing protein [Planctomycetota bacterium]
FHLLDGDENIICLMRDNETIASEADIVRDHDLMKRTHTYGILAADNRQTDEFSASLVVYEGHRQGEYATHIGHKMFFTLRPGEALVWQWGHIQKVHGGFDGSVGMKSWGDRAAKLICNGKMLYTPDLRKPSGRHALSASENVAFGEADTSKPALFVKTPGQPAHATFSIQSPYVIIGGAVRLLSKRQSADGQLKVSLSFDGKAFQPATAGSGFEEVINLDPHFPPIGPARYAYFLKVEMSGGAGLESIAFDTDVQMAPLSLPALELGENKLLYTDETQGSAVRRMRITHNWVERSAAKAPSAPAAPVFPENGAAVEGTQVTFKWQEPTESGAAKVTDYHFQLSQHADLRWPLSPNFDKLISNTASKGKPEYALPYVGLVNPGQEYYWRVRARNNAGVWSGWSPVWKFTPQGPGVPVSLRLAVNRDARTVTLGWSANSRGRRPVRYKVYGSNEKGFTASDKEYEVLTESIQITGKRTVEKFPSNLVGETQETRLVVVGPDLKLPNANKAHYRVVAVDEKGIESGPSDQAFVQR